MPYVAGHRVADVIRTCTALAGLALLSATASAAEPEPANFGDWVVGCDNLKHCTALSLSCADDDPIAYLRLKRAAGPDAPAKLVLRLRGNWKLPILAVQVKLDGAPVSIGRDAKQLGVDGETLPWLSSRPRRRLSSLAPARRCRS